MTTREIAGRLAALCAKADFQTAQHELYADNVISVEPEEVPGLPKEVNGKDAVLQKIKDFEAGVETMHSIRIGEPQVAEAAIAFTMEIDMTPKKGERKTIAEVCVYEVKGGKIVSERFFW